MLAEICHKIRTARSLLLSTHRHADGDGLGAEIALYHGLRKLGKEVRILNVDPPPLKYQFLQTQELVEVYHPGHGVLPQMDLVLIFDTNDHRLTEPLFSALQGVAQDILFIDHHPLLEKGPAPTPGSWIQMLAASTGEITYNLICELGIPLDAQIARALYTSLVFDTQVFRYIRTSANSHLMAAELLRYEKNPEEVHRHLFANYTPQKIQLLARCLERMNYYYNNRVALVYVDLEDLKEVDPDASRDIIDLVMNVESLEAAIFIREDGPSELKVSLRSRGRLNVQSVAESLGGGGHLYSAGAYVRASRAQTQTQILQELHLQIEALP